MQSRILYLGALLSLPAICSVAAAEASIDAERIYQESCSVCHGDDGRGAVWGQASLSVPPRNFRTAESREQLTRERMIASVTAGRPGTPMPGFGTQLRIPEITAVGDWGRSEFMTPAIRDTGRSASRSRVTRCPKIMPGKPLAGHYCMRRTVSTATARMAAGMDREPISFFRNRGIFTTRRPANT